MGSNKVLRVALGHGEEDEYKKGLSALAEDISGSIGLFFTRLPQDQVSIQLISCILLLRLYPQGAVSAPMSSSPHWQPHGFSQKASGRSYSFAW